MTNWRSRAACLKGVSWTPPGLKFCRKCPASPNYKRSFWRRSMRRRRSCCALFKSPARKWSDCSNPYAKPKENDKKFPTDLLKGGSYGRRIKRTGERLHQEHDLHG